MGHSGVAGHFSRFGEASVLNLAGSDDPLSYRKGGFGRPCFGEFLVFHRRRLHMEIDTIKEGSRDLLTITLHLSWRASALPFRVAIVTAGARVHGCDEHEFTWKTHCSTGPCNYYRASFERLAKNFQGRAMKFRQFIQKKDSVMG
jgi:hypothetical protein